MRAHSSRARIAGRTFVSLSASESEAHAPLREHLRPNRHRPTATREEEGEEARASLRGRRNEVRSSVLFSSLQPMESRSLGDGRSRMRPGRSESLDERVRWKPAYRGDVFGHGSPHALSRARRPPTSSTADGVPSEAHAKTREERVPARLGVRRIERPVFDGSNARTGLRSRHRTPALSRGYAVEPVATVQVGRAFSPLRCPSFRPFRTS